MKLKWQKEVPKVVPKVAGWIKKNLPFLVTIYSKKLSIWNLYKTLE